jgi:NADPH-dependent 2,4-dienoyl-CoA reductase/sulfur reductase-like enzyme
MKSYDFMVLGSGVAAGYAVQEFAQRNTARAKLALITADTSLPYDRPPLSKGFLAGEKTLPDIMINPKSFYHEHGIEVLANHFIRTVDFDRKRLLSESGEEFGYEKLLIATGSEPRRLDVPGANLEGVHYLRLLDDAARIRAEMQHGRTAVVIGAGFIGMEVASVLARKGLDTTIVFPQERVWQSFFTPEMSAFFQGYFGERGVKFLPHEKVAAFSGQQRVSSVRLESGRELPADLVVAGIGIVPAVRLFQDTRLQIENGIVVNEFLETSVPDVWAAGDVTNFPDSIFQKRRRVEHWDNAVVQGRVAGRNLLGLREPFEHVLYFFSDVFDLSYEFWGDTTGHDYVIHRGEMSRGSFSTWWLRDFRLVAAFALNRPDEERELAPKWIRDGLRLDPEILQDDNRTLKMLAAA